MTDPGRRLTSTWPGWRGLLVEGGLPAAYAQALFPPALAETWATVAVARDWGCPTVTLQSSEMALPIYTRMGFRPVVGYQNFTG